MKAFLLQYLVFVFIGSCPSDDANLIIIFLIFMSQFVICNKPNKHYTLIYLLSVYGSVYALSANK